MFHLKKCISFLILLLTTTILAEKECLVTTGENCNNNSYYLVNKANMYAITNSDNMTLYYCNNEKVACEEVIEPGYYIVNKEIVFKCRMNGLVNQCSKFKIEENECTEDTIGKLYSATQSSIISLCLNVEGTIKSFVDLNKANSGDYIVSRGEDNIFGLVNYGLLRVEDKKITLDAEYNNGLKYVFVNKLKNYRVMVKGETCPMTGSPNILDRMNILEFMCSKGLCTMQ